MYPIYVLGQRQYEVALIPVPAPAPEAVEQSASCGEKEADGPIPTERGIGIMIAMLAVLDLVAKVLSISASGLTIYILISRKRPK